MEPVVTTGARRHAKLQSNRHYQSTNEHPAFYRPEALPSLNQVSEHWGKKYHIPLTCSPEAHLSVFQPYREDVEIMRYLLLVYPPSSFDTVCGWSFYCLISFRENTVYYLSQNWGTGIRGLIRGMATLPQGNQEILMVRDKVERPPGELGVSKSMECCFSLQCFDTVGWVTGRASGL